jgi:hypothetical protein
LLSIWDAIRATSSSRLAPHQSIFRRKPAPDLIRGAPGGRPAFCGATMTPRRREVNGH